MLAGAYKRVGEWVAQKLNEEEDLVMLLEREVNYKQVRSALSPQPSAQPSDQPVRCESRPASTTCGVDALPWITARVEPLHLPSPRGLGPSVLLTWCCMRDRSTTRVAHLFVVRDRMPRQSGGGAQLSSDEELFWGLVDNLKSRKETEENEVMQRAQARVGVLNQSVDARNELLAAAMAVQQQGSEAAARQLERVEARHLVLSPRGGVRAAEGSPHSRAGTAAELLGDTVSGKYSKQFDNTSDKCDQVWSRTSTATS